MHIYIYIYTSVDPCITCTEVVGIELCEFDYVDSRSEVSKSIFELYFESLLSSSSMGASEFD